MSEKKFSRGIYSARIKVMISNKNNKVALVTGSAGFIGFHIARRLLSEGWSVIGVDSLTDYYDVNLKRRRESILLQMPQYVSYHFDIADEVALDNLFSKYRPECVVHLAAQAGVRFSIDVPNSYLNSNVIGSFRMLEAARRYPPTHFLLASTSSVYGASTNYPYTEEDKADEQISFYAATKKSTENFAHAYSHLYKIPTSVFRFFTVYGPWGRPDMALFKFTKAIIEETPIDLYNHGNMCRDFTYVDDLIEAVWRLIDIPPCGNRQLDGFEMEKAPYRVVNIGNSSPIPLLEFVAALENTLGKKADVNLLPMQKGDVHTTWAKSDLLYELVKYRPTTNIDKGIEEFVSWYKKYYRVT